MQIMKNSISIIYNTSIDSCLSFEDRPSNLYGVNYYACASLCRSLAQTFFYQTREALLCSANPQMGFQMRLYSNSTLLSKQVQWLHVFEKKIENEMKNI